VIGFVSLCATHPVSHCDKTLALLVGSYIVNRPQILGISVAIQFAVPILACAGDVYSSTGPTGQRQWSTHVIDSSYKLESELSSPNPSPAPTSAGANKVQLTAKQIALDQRRNKYRPLVEAIARRHGVSDALVMALIEVESNFNPRAISGKGARGLMQLLPSTAAAYGLRNVQDLYDPARNIDIGTRHLKDLLEQHGSQWALAMSSYNAGSQAVRRHGQRIPSYYETMLYVPAVLAIAAQLTAAKDVVPIGTNVHE